MLKKYKNDERGNFATMAALSMMVLLMGTGVAIDYNNVVNSRAYYQSVADIAVLAAAASGETESKALKKVARKAVKETLKTKGIKANNIKVKINGNDITVNVMANHETSLMSIFGHKTLDVNVAASSQLPSGGKKNIAFVLDTTGSMTGSKMTTLKAAMSDFIDDLESELAANTVNVSIVPFAEYVRLPMHYASANWITVEPPELHTWQVLDEDNSVNCRQVGTGENMTTECDSYTYIDKSDTVHWEGCIASRPNGYHAEADYAGQKFFGFNGTRALCPWDFDVLLPLTSDISDLESAVTGLNTTSGGTYIPAGLAWGWRTLTEDEPFTESFPIDSDTESLLVLMTDGENTRNINPGVFNNARYHWDWGSDLSNPLTTDLCTKIKTDGIEIATIAYEVNDAATLTILENCASNSANFYSAKNSAQLKAAFAKIGQGNKHVRLTR